MTIFTSLSMLLEKVACIHAATGLGIVEGAVERRMELRALFGRKLVVDHDDLDLGTIGQITRLIEPESAVLHFDLQRLHLARSLPLSGSVTLPKLCQTPRN